MDASAAEPATTETPAATGEPPAHAVVKQTTLDQIASDIERLAVYLQRQAENQQSTPGGLVRMPKLNVNRRLACDIVVFLTALAGLLAALTGTHA